ncbi:autophagy-related protein 27 [Syncephalastrum racemosum]|uniref:Autophagy-related protein 27 n=1 Tax=Syncephalastrum racemosum TaxID=13706 RepID=A0A1X2HUJ6_SYNRA|nr:autophagy-related protein 27 [Syncephalastrum racemosum]
MRLLLGVIPLLLSATGTLAIQAYCDKGYKLENTDYKLDLSKLNKEFVLTATTEQPPTTLQTSVAINVCDALKRPDGLAEADFCQQGASICRREVLLRKDQDQDQKPFVAVVQDIAGDFSDAKMNPSFSLPEPDKDLTKSGTKLSLKLDGRKWKEQQQSAQIIFECDESGNRNDDPKAPTLISYTNGMLLLEWKTVQACALKDGEKVPDNDSPKDGNNGGENGGGSGGMSGVGIFFTIIGVLLGVYFVGGAFYNFRMYNARGLDLIPHRDFWLDLPYLIKDLMSHIRDSVLSHRRGGGGYVAV